MTYCAVVHLPDSVGCGVGRPFPPERPGDTGRRLPHLPARLVTTHSSTGAALAQVRRHVRYGLVLTARRPGGKADNATAWWVAYGSTLHNFSKIYLRSRFVNASMNFFLKPLI